jgi:hypothetical protein
MPVAAAGAKINAQFQIALPMQKFLGAGGGFGVGFGSVANFPAAAARFGRQTEFFLHN